MLQAYIIFKNVLKLNFCYAIVQETKKEIKGGKNLKSGIKTLAIWLILGFIFIGLLSAVFNNSDTKMSYSELLSRINTGDIKEIELSSDGKEAYVTTKNSNAEKQVIYAQNIKNN